MARRKNIIPRVLPLRSTRWTRWRWFTSAAWFRTTVWTVLIATATAGIWSQWGVIQPALAEGIRNVAVVVLGEDYVAQRDGESTTTTESLMEPATVKQREKLGTVIDTANDQITATGTTLPDTATTTLKSVIAECQKSILDPSTQSVSMDFCIQQVDTETKNLNTATAAEIKRVADEKAAAEAAAAQAAAEEAARQAAEEAARQQQQNSGGGNSGGSGGGSSGGSGGGNSGGGNSGGGSGGGSTTQGRTVVVSCTTGPATVTVSDPGGGGGTKTIPAGGSASFTVYQGASMSAQGGTCSMSFG